MPNSGEKTLKQRFRNYLNVAIVPNGIAVAITIMLALLILVLTSTTLAALPATIAEIWLVANLVPAHADGITIGVLPMLPAIALGAGVARKMRKTVGRHVTLRDLSGIILACLGVPVLLSITAWAMLLDASQVFDLKAPNFFLVVLNTFLVHASAIAIGMGQKLWRSLAKHWAISTDLVTIIRATWTLFLELLVLGLLAAIVSLAVHHQALMQSLQPYNGQGILALVGVCLLYLPNVAIAATSMLLGADFQIQGLSLSLFEAQPPVLPPVPWFAAFAFEHHAWMPLLMLLPAVLILRFAMNNLASWKQLAASASALGLVMLLGTWFAGGALGYFDTVGPTVWLSTLLAVVWLAAIGAAVLGVAALLARKAVVEPEVVEAVEEPEEAPEDQPEAAEEILEGEVIEESEPEEDIEDVDQASPDIEPEEPEHTEEPEEPEPAEGPEEPEEPEVPEEAEEAVEAEQPAEDLEDDQPDPPQQRDS
ncbi:hypothetical protein CPPEL_07885 [Corynebacterium pseudopelargi]|uniref:Uncharacterized protein n=1 Tax=Corynebacterium pseudopelargi TaxID=2080757 RepID=A0A3G6IV76_9CORY|nr:hypothetical protein CPPEL_07885 [Corynebacterium pseudopelargi]